MATIITATGARFDTEKPAKSNILMVFDDNGKRVFDTLRITGNTTNITEFGKPKTMVEVEHSFGKDEVNEDFLWQN